MLTQESCDSCEFEAPAFCGGKSAVFHHLLGGPVLRGGFWRGRNFRIRNLTPMFSDRFRRTTRWARPPPCPIFSKKISREVETVPTSCKAGRQKAPKDAKMALQVGETRPDRFRKKASTDGANQKINGREISAEMPCTQGGNTTTPRSPRWQGQVTPPLFISM